MARVLMVIPPERFRDEELFEPRKALEQAGHAVVVASEKKGRCAGSRGGSAVSEKLLAEVDPADFDGVVFVGGGGSKLLFRNDCALSIAREMHKAGKIVAAICLAPVILANAGVLRGRHATVAGTEAKAIEARGAIYTGPGVTVDGNVVTANAPKASVAFGQRVCELLTRAMAARVC